ncbi:hypothetical protein DSUL_20255 [Desulfovibrionales bacterium]
MLFFVNILILLLSSASPPYTNLYSKIIYLLWPLLLMSHDYLIFLWHTRDTNCRSHYRISDLDL